MGLKDVENQNITMMEESKEWINEPLSEPDLPRLMAFQD